MEQCEFNLHRQWKNLMRSRRYRLRAHGRRRVACVQISSAELQSSHYVELGDLRVTIAHDEVDATDDSPSFIVNRCRVGLGQGGVHWGIGLAPMVSAFEWGSGSPAKGPFSIDEPQRLRNLIELEKRIAKGGSRRSCVARHPQFPRLWAGYRKAEVDQCVFRGQAYHQFRSRWPWPHETLRLVYQREHVDNLVLLPAMWVIDDLSRAQKIFAELNESSRFNVFRLGYRMHQLRGASRGITWDFTNEEPLRCSSSRTACGASN